MPSLNIPEGDEDDAVDDIELFQNAGHAGSRELENKRDDNMIRPHLISLTDTCLATLRYTARPEITPLQQRCNSVETQCRLAQLLIGHLERRDAGAGAILVDLVHGPLQSNSLLGEVLEVLRALLGLLVSLAHLRERSPGVQDCLQ